MGRIGLSGSLTVSKLPEIGTCISGSIAKSDQTAVYSIGKPRLYCRTDGNRCRSACGTAVASGYYNGISTRSQIGGGSSSLVIAPKVSIRCRSAGGRYGGAAI